MHYKTALPVLIFCSFLANNLLGQLIDIGIFNNPSNSNLLEIRIRPTANFSGGYIATVFTIKWLDAYGVTLNVNSSPYGVSSETPTTNNGYKYQVFSFIHPTSGYNVNWISGQEYVLAIIAHSNNGSGNGTFEISSDPYTSSINGDHYQELNIGGFNEERTGMIYQASASSPLPIDLKKFKALVTPTCIPLLWETANEYNFSGFEIQRSLNGKKFIHLSWIPGKGGQAGSSYRYEDKDVQPGITYYYRLKIVDNDGSFEYSPVVSARLEGQNSSVKLYPNPSAGQVTMEWYAIADETLSVEVFSETGRLMLNREFEVQKGNNPLKLDLQDFPPGLYLLRATSAGTTFSGKILRSR